MTAEHAQAVLAIYQDGADAGDATFDADHLPEHRFVASDPTGQVLGWIAAAAVSSRRGYAGVIEHSVCVARSARGHGIGTLLLHALIESSENAGIWTLQCGAFPENTASLALRARAGFRGVETREPPGQHQNRWRDVILLERRSSHVGQ
jgi:phosphinothricin acetyltransferase